MHMYKTEKVQKDVVKTVSLLYPWAQDPEAASFRWNKCFQRLPLGSNLALFTHLQYLPGLCSTECAPWPIYSTSSAFPKHLPYHSHFHNDFLIGLPSRLGESQIHEVRIYVLFFLSIAYYLGYYQIEMYRFAVSELLNEQTVYYFQGPGLRCDSNSN